VGRGLNHQQWAIKTLSNEKGPGREFKHERERKPPEAGNVVYLGFPKNLHSLLPTAEKIIRTGKEQPSRGHLHRFAQLQKQASPSRQDTIRPEGNWGANGKTANDVLGSDVWDVVESPSWGEGGRDKEGEA